jgi:hypothetical protein
VVHGPQTWNLYLEETAWYVQECAAVPTGSICGGRKEVETEASNLNIKHSGYFFLFYAFKN